MVMRDKQSNYTLLQTAQIVHRKPLQFTVTAYRDVAAAFNLLWFFYQIVEAQLSCFSLIQKDFKNKKTQLCHKLKKSSDWTS